MRNAVFFDLFKDQMNLLMLREGTVQKEVRFTPEHSSKELRVHETKPAKG